MATGIFNLIMGIVGIVGGLMGRTLFGVGPPMLLTAVGAGIAALGIYQMIQSRRGG